MSARIACRSGTSLLNRAPIIGLSIALAVGFLGLSPRSATAAPFTPVIEYFQIFKDDASIFFDGFNTGVVPPEGPVGTPYSVTGPAGMTSESGGRLTMTPSLGVPTTGLGSADTITRALRTASTDPTSSNHLGAENKVVVRGLFNISLPNTLPTIQGQNFGIRLQDGAGDGSADGVASLSVGLNPAGQLRVRFHEASTNTTADTFLLPSLVGAAFIELFITKDANSASPYASFTILDALFGVLLVGTLDNNNVITFFNGETFVRGAFYSTDAVPLPGALPLFATVLAGGGLMAWRRRRKAAKLATN